MFLSRRRVVGVIGKVVPIFLELGDGRLHLWDRGADIGQLDNVGMGCLGEFAEFFQSVADSLLFGQTFREACNDPAGK